jgi:alkanesulfonate monooxygenase SsuD/methylene tetrahydromethanopterin reductase-like flavin-dependent oxidoreductase (luciferase family)
MDLEFGLFDWVDAAPGRSVAEVYDARLRILADADSDGFATYHLAEHHGTPLGLAPSPSVFIAAAARVTERIRLAPTTFVVPCTSRCTSRCGWPRKSRCSIS